MEASTPNQAARPKPTRRLNFAQTAQLANFITAHFTARGETDTEFARHAESVLGFAAPSHTIQCMRQQLNIASTRDVRKEAARQRREAAEAERVAEKKRREEAQRQLFRAKDSESLLLMSLQARIAAQEAAFDRLCALLGEDGTRALAVRGAMMTQHKEGAPV